MTEPDRLDVESRRLRSALEAWFGCGRTKDKASLDALRAAAVRWIARVDEADRERPKDVSANLDLKALRERLESSLAPDQLHAILLMWAERDVLKTELERSRAEVDRLQKLIANDGGWTLPRRILEELRAEPVEQPPKMRGKKALARLLEALTPSGATKAAYSGEFRFSFVHGVDEDGNDVSINVQVPWTTIKDVMAAILKRAEVAREDAEGFPVALVAVADPETDILGSVGLASSFDVRRLGETCRVCHASFDEPACGPLHALVAHERRIWASSNEKPTAGEGGNHG